MNTAEEVSVLIVDDYERILFAFTELFAHDGIRTITARDGLSAIAVAKSERPSIAFLDITMPRLDGLSALAQLKELDHDLPVIIITGFGTADTAIRAMQLGAFDYLTKPLDVVKIRTSATRALEARRAGSAALGPALSDADDSTHLIGRSAAMQDVYKLIGSISTTPNTTTVLITGETGTGKELVARAIHRHGAHAASPFIAIDCTVLSEMLLESELFGHEKGAFTGAIARKQGKFELAGEGTIFLDEIGNLTLPLQQKLLRVVQERCFERVGGMDSLPISARFIAATNTDLTSAVAAGRFREDFYFRLNVARIHIPPLRERPDDIVQLAEHFLRKHSIRLNRTVRGFAPNVLEPLLTYAFPGNVRELENLIARAVMLSPSDLITHSLITAAPQRMDIASDDSFQLGRAKVLDQFEKQFVIDTLTKFHGNVTASAEASGMTRQNFQRLMVKHDVRGEKFREG